MENTVEYTLRMKKELNAQVLVVGAGMAGFGAAVAAARNGARVLLIDRAAMAGGMATTGLVGPFMTCFNNNDDGKGRDRQLIMGIFDELCRRTEEKGGAIHPEKVEGMTSYCSYLWDSHRHVTPFQSEILALVMDEMLEEAGVTVLFGVTLCDCIVEGGRVSRVIVAMKEGLCAIRAELIIDCSGDADAAWFAGAPTVLGNGRGTMQPTSLFFEVDHIDRDRFLGELEANRHRLNRHGANCFHWIIEEKKKTGEWTIDRDELGNYEQNLPGRWKINTTRMAGVDATDTAQSSEALREGRRQVQQVLAFMRENLPGCEEIRLVQVASALGVRETRHIAGHYTLTVEDIMEQRRFADSVVSFAYALDVHNASGGGVTFTCVKDYYNIPYRCLLPRGVDNMLVAGRCISGDSEAAASYRVMPACCALGQAAGTAAAIALKAGVNPARVDTDLLRKTLRDQGAVICD